MSDALLGEIDKLQAMPLLSPETAQLLSLARQVQAGKMTLETAIQSLGPAASNAGEFWKYDGIYTAQAAGQGYAGYGHSNHGRAALPWLRSQGFTSLLDVGCGHNELVKAWGGVLSVGVDFACPGADVIAPATALPFADGLFDVVTSFDMLEHLPEHEVLPALREMRRVAHCFCFSIATAPSRILWQWQNLHPTVKPMSWWLDRISEAGGVIDNDGPAGYVCGRWDDPDEETLRQGEEETG